MGKRNAHLFSEAPAWENVTDICFLRCLWGKVRLEAPSRLLNDAKRLQDATKCCHRSSQEARKLPNDARMLSDAARRVPDVARRVPDAASRLPDWKNL